MKFVYVGKEVASDSLKARAEKKPMAKPGKTVNAQRYSQRDYTEEELAGASEELMKEAMEENHG